MCEIRLHVQRVRVGSYCARVGSYFTQSVCAAVLQKSVPTQIRQDISNDKGYVVGFMRELTFAKRVAPASEPPPPDALVTLRVEYRQKWLQQYAFKVC